MESREGVSKQDIREQIWDYMESQNIADFPRPVHHRIPNFKGSFRACQNIKDLEVFARVQEVKVDPDKPLEGVRLLALQSKKMLLVPTPRLRTGLFNRITPPPGATKDVLRKCATSQGVRNYSVPMGLDSRVLVDLVVVGSVAVSEKAPDNALRCASCLQICTNSAGAAKAPLLQDLWVDWVAQCFSQGWRIGKGEGYADLEYAMMASMGAVSQGTPVVTIVHDCQVVDIPDALMEDHDLTVDYILTPTRVITTGCTRPRPAGVVWSKISCEMMGRIPILRSLRSREKQAGKDVTLQDEHQHVVETRSPHTAPPSAVRRPCDPPQPEVGEDVPSNSVYVGNLPGDARVSELKRALGERGVAPLWLTWQGPQHRAFLHYPDPAEAQRAVSCLQGLHLGANTLRVALARQQRTRDLTGGRVGELHPDCFPTI